MNVLVPSQSVTPEDLLRMPDGDRFELVNGRLVETDRSFWASYIAGQVLYFLETYLHTHPLGWVVSEGATYQCFPSRPNQVRKPDVSFVLFSRYSATQAQQEGHCRVPPDLVIEVISPNDLVAELNLKLVDYLDAAIPLVWVIDPEAQIVWVLFRGTVRLLRAGDELDGEDVLPGFRCPLAALFAVPPAAQAPEGTSS